MDEIASAFRGIGEDDRGRKRVPIVITRVLWSACLMAAVVAGPGVSAAQSSPPELPLRLQWEADPPRDGLQAVCGRVFNDQSATAWHVVSSWKSSMGWTG